MSLVEHAKLELSLSGLLNKDSDYGGGIGRAVLELVECFAKQGHSGFSAEWTLEVFDKLARFKPLTPISGNPKEWFDHGNMGPNGERIWQNKRRGSTFSRDGGTTWYDLDDPSLNNGDVWRRAAPELSP